MAQGDALHVSRAATIVHDLAIVTPSILLPAAIAATLEFSQGSFRLSTSMFTFDRMHVGGWRVRGGAPARMAAAAAAGGAIQMPGGMIALLSSLHAARGGRRSTPTRGS